MAIRISTSGGSWLELDDRLAERPPVSV